MHSILLIMWSIVAAVVYGILHDQVTARVCVEYFTIGHPPLFDTHDPTWLGLGWGIVATWWVGLVLGVGLAVAARFGRRPKRTAGTLVRPVVLLMCISAVIALVGGLAGWALAEVDMVNLHGRLARMVPAERHAAYIGDLWAHTASYLAGFFGGCVVVVRVWVSRGEVG